MTLSEIKRLLVLSKRELNEKFSVREIGLFGSYVRNEQKPVSDLDILVDFEKPVSLMKIVALENFLNDMLGIKTDVVPKDDVRSELRNIIYDETVYI
jgi:predicted nucleotidyltransferase